MPYSLLYLYLNDSSVGHQGGEGSGEGGLSGIDLCASQYATVGKDGHTLIRLLAKLIEELTDTLVLHHE